MKTTNSFKIKKSRLVGQVKVSGAKNSALRLLAAFLLTKETIELFNFPNGLLDAQVHLEMLKVLKSYVKNNNFNNSEIQERIKLFWNGKNVPLEILYWF